MCFDFFNICVVSFNLSCFHYYEIICTLNHFSRKHLSYQNIKFNKKHDFFLWSIQNEVILILFFIIIQSAQSIAERWVTHSFILVSISLIINFNKASAIDLWFTSIISFTCELYDEMIIQWISYFFARIFITSLFSDSLSQINFWKYLYWQITFSQRNFIIFAEFNKASALVSDYLKKLFWTLMI